LFLLCGFALFLLFAVFSRDLAVVDRVFIPVAAAVALLIAGPGWATVFSAATERRVDVEFAGPDSRCGTDSIWFDDETGDRLRCLRLGVDAAGNGGYGEYLTPGELDQIEDFAQELAGDADGLTDDDEERVQDLTDELAENSVDNER
jgi:hypothetical protein